MTGIYQRICTWRNKKQKAIAMLIDPDKYNRETIVALNRQALLPDLILVGGSLVMHDTDDVVIDLRKTTEGRCPIVLFPGDFSQLSGNADALLLLSLVSGRNAEYLIGQQIKAAPRIRQLKLEAIPTGYMLIESGHTTSVEYISGTQPLPFDKPDIATATAMAAEMLGMKLLYLEAGSGAEVPVGSSIISAVRKNTDIPIIVGGGLRDAAEIDRAFRAGADIVVVGTAIEKNPLLASEILKRKKQ